MYVALFLEADVEVELGIAGKVLEADFNVIRFAGLYTHAVCLRTAAVFVGEVLHLFAVDEQLYGTVAVEVEHNIAALPGSEYALVNGREIGEVYARCKTVAPEVQRWNGVLSCAVAAGSPLNSVLFQ